MTQLDDDPHGTDEQRQNLLDKVQFRSSAALAPKRTLNVGVHNDKLFPARINASRYRKNSYVSNKANDANKQRQRKVYAFRQENASSPFNASDEYVNPNVTVEDVEKATTLAEKTMRFREFIEMAYSDVIDSYPYILGIIALAAILSFGWIALLR